MTDRPQSSIYSRAGSAATTIARDLLEYSPGDRIPTVADYARVCGVGIHTVQRALALLSANELARFQARGRLGTFVASMDRQGLWLLAMSDPLVCFMPLPYSKQYEGLATGIRAGLEAIEIPFTIAFTSGARVRVRMTRQRSAFAVVSALAAQHLAPMDDGLAIAVIMPPGSFVTRHGVIWRTGPRPPRPRVGIDDDSVDQAVLSRAEFGDRADYIPLHYLQLIESLRRGIIDAAVWNVDSISGDDVIVVCPLESDDARRLDVAATQAALVAARDNVAVLRLLKEYIDPARVLQIQREVAAATRAPTY